MSGWIHTCCNGNRLVVRHGDMSGYVEVEEGSGDGRHTILIPGNDILRLVAKFVRTEKMCVAEQEIYEQSDAEIIGLTRLPGVPSDVEETDG